MMSVLRVHKAVGDTLLELQNFWATHAQSMGVNAPYHHITDLTFTWPPGEVVDLRYTKARL